MDHHCPWVNNCVGENNQKYFVLFTVSSQQECISYNVVLTKNLALDYKVKKAAKDQLSAYGNKKLPQTVANWDTFYRPSCTF